MTTEVIPSLTSQEVESLPVRYTPTDLNHAHFLQGDLEDHGPEALLAIFGHVVEQTHRSVERHSELPADLSEHLASYYRQIDGFRRYVADSRNYPPFARESIISRYARADAQSEGLSVIKRIAARIKTGDGVIDVSDFDGTMTNDPEQYLRSGFPGGQLVEDLLDQHTMAKVREVFVQTQHGIYTQAPWIFRLAGRLPSVSFTAGIEAYYEQTKERPRIILSCQFIPFILGYLDRMPAHLVEGLAIWGLGHENAVSPEKDLVVEHYAKQNPSRTLHFIGDGSTDEKAITSLTGYIHARRGMGLARTLDSRGIIYLPYSDFNEIKAHEEELQYLVV